MEPMEPMQDLLQPMQRLSQSPEDKLQRRRERRWKRRARVAGPFVGISILLAALSLSVDLIEYQPRIEPDRLSDRPIHVDPRPVSEKTGRSDSLRAASVASSVSIVPDRESKISADLLALDLALPSAGTAPTTPDELR